MAKKKTSIKSTSKRATNSFEDQDEIFEISVAQEAEETKNRKVVCLGMEFSNDAERRKYFTEKLREKLKDPQFRNIEGFPIGSDEDILTLSDPPYYTACPNPFVNEFIRIHSVSHNSKKPYHREPFATDVSEGKTGALYNAHSYHTKVPPKAIENYILHFTEPGDLVLDGFSGTGMTGVAVHLTNDDRKCLLFDLSPAASFISAVYNSRCNPSDYQRYAEQLLAKLESEMSYLYETRQPKTNKLGIIESIIWSTVMICPSCSEQISFWSLKEKNENLECPRCRSISSRASYDYAVETYTDPVNRQVRRRNKKIPVQITFKIGKKRYIKEPDEKDFQHLTDVSKVGELDWFPTELILGVGVGWGDTYRAGYHFGYEYIYDFYFSRTLAILSRLRKEAMKAPMDLRLHLMALLTSVAFAATHLYKYRTTGGGQPAGNNLYIPALIKEQNILSALRRKLGDLVAAEWEKMKWKLSTQVSTASATALYGVPEDSIDYVFVDPPFGANIMYSESSFLWESWLKIRTNQKTEAIINNTQAKGLPEYQILMTRCFREFLRVLKSGRWMTVEFHNSQNAVWTSIQEALGHAGFVVADVRIMDKQQGTFKQVTTSGAVKQDLVISAYKPNGGLEERFRLEAGKEEGVWDFVQTHMKQLPVFVCINDQVEIVAERQNYLLFDRMVAFHVQRGVSVPLSASEFYNGLTQRFPERDGMFFLNDQVVEYDQKKMRSKGIVQLELFVTDESSAIQWLQREFKEQPRTFQEIHPRFMKEIAGWEKHEKPLELKKIIEQNFLCYDGLGEVPNPIHSYLSSNFKELRKLAKDHPSLRSKAKDRWYLPDPNKAGDLEKLREKALLREFWDYLPPGYVPPKPDLFSGQLTFLDERRKKDIPTGKKLRIIRLEAVRAGFRHCWQNKDYHTIIAVANRIPEDVLQEDSQLLMWFGNAQTRLGENV